MPPEAEWVRNWATTARRDLLAAERLLREPPVFADIVCFHAQQVVEKALKAFLVYHDVPFEKVHAIRYLLDLCEPIAPEFALLRD